jgi:tRNA modification GTPase
VVDTAGIREAHRMAEREGVRRSLRAIEEADLVLAVFDAAEPLHDEDRRVLEEVRGRSAILVLNKTDLAPDADPFRGLAESPGLPPDIPVVRVSARTEAGMEALKDAVCEAALGSPAGHDEGVVVTNLRHRLALDAARERLRAAGAVLGREPLEIVALELRESLDRLGEIVGAVTTEDILGRIFSEFCIGK